MPEALGRKTPRGSIVAYVTEGGAAAAGRHPGGRHRPGLQRVLMQPLKQARPGTEWRALQIAP
jgi:hypothetical protein